MIIYDQPEWPIWSEMISFGSYFQYDQKWSGADLRWERDKLREISAVSQTDHTVVHSKQLTYACLTLMLSKRSRSKPEEDCHVPWQQSTTFPRVMCLHNRNLRHGYRLWLESRARERETLPVFPLELGAGTKKGGAGAAEAPMMDKILSIYPFKWLILRTALLLWRITGPGGCECDSLGRRRPWCLYDAERERALCILGTRVQGYACVPVPAYAYPRMCMPVRTRDMQREVQGSTLYAYAYA